MASVDITINPLLEGNGNAAYLNNDNFITSVKNHDAKPQNDQTDNLGVRRLGRMTGLALGQLATAAQTHDEALRTGTTATITTADIDIIDSGVTFLDTPITY